MIAPAFEDLLRELTPQVLAALVRQHGQFEGCEDAVQEAVLAAVQWPADGVPGNPRGWLATVACRRLIDQVRSHHARRERQSATATEVAPEDVPDTDDTLNLLFLCCHPTLTAASQTALTLRAVGGLTTARDRHRSDLTHEAIRLVRMVHAQLPEDGEVTGLLALMLLTHACREARTTAVGDLVPLEEQDRTKWDRGLIDEGVELVKASLAGPTLGPSSCGAPSPPRTPARPRPGTPTGRRCTPFT